MYSERNNNSVKTINKNIPSRNKWKKERWKNDVRNWSLCVPSLLALVCYVNGLHGDFVHDDVIAIQNNNDVRGSSPVSGLWLNDFWGKAMSANTSHKSYRPVTVLTFRWNYMTTGQDPFYFHAVNVILHVVVTSMFVFTCKDVFEMSRTCSIVAGALFAVHPIHTEAVTGIVGRADVLSAVFFLLAFITYVRSLNSTPRDFPAVEHCGMFLTSFILAATGMLCKETGITALGVCLLYDVGVVCRRAVVRFFKDIKAPRPDCAPLVRRILAVATITFCLMAVRLWLMGGTMPHFAFNDNPASFQSSPWTRYLTYGYIWAYNGWVLIMPFDLCYDWQNGSIPLVETIDDPRNLATLFFMTVLVAATYKLFYNFKADPECQSSPDPALVSVIFTVIPFLPASNVFFRVGFVLAERILYIPSMGFCISVAVGFCKLMERWPYKRSQVVAILCCLLLVLAGKTWRRNEDWRTREALFRSGINTLPHNSKVQYNYANFFKDSDRHKEAIYHYKETIRLDPEHASAYNNLGTLLDDGEEKLWYLTKALEITPKHVGAHINVGNLYLNTGNTSESLRYLYRAVELESRSPDPKMALSWALMETGAAGKAEVHMRNVVAAYPGHAKARLQYGDLLDRLGRHEDAVNQYKAAHELDGTEKLALVFAAKALNKLGDTVQAEALLKRAIAIQRDAETLEQLAMLYYDLGRLDESVTLYDEVSRMSDNSSDIIIRQAQMFSNARDTDKAEALLHQLLRQHPGNKDAMITLAMISCNVKKYAKGIELLSRAISHCERTRVPVPEIALFERGNCHRPAEQLEEALQDFQTVLRLNPTHVGAHTNAGCIYHLWENIEQARYHYTEALRMDPGLKIAEDNLVKLNRMQGQRSQGIG